MGRLQVGRMASSWGLGLLASDGSAENDFGDAYYGDIVDRVLFATRPWSVLRTLFDGETPAEDPLVLAIAFDWNVVRDRLSKRAEDKVDLTRASTPESEIVLRAEAENDEVQQGIVGLRLDTETFEGGLYAVRREMEHLDALVAPANRPDEEFLRAWVLDVYGKLVLHPGFLDGGELFLEAEAAYIQGETNLTVSRVLQTPTDPFPESDVEQLGWIARGGVRLDRVDVVLEAGFASGDGDPFDDEVRNFRFHPDLNVGMILFEDLLAETSAASARNAVQVFDEGGPVKTQGASLLPTHGAVTNAVYVHPRVRIRPWDALEAVVGVVWARTDADFVDPSTDFVLGGASGVFNPYGAPASNRELGWEIDVGLAYGFDLDLGSLDLGLQYGHLFPGDVFEDVDGNRMADVDKVQGRATWAW